MLIFKKEYGSPADLIIDTEEYHDEKNEFHGYRSLMKDGDGILIKEFYHENFRDRVHWADGYMTALTK